MTRVRRDGLNGGTYTSGRGDAWAFQHRERLPGSFYMTDMDSLCTTSGGFNWEDSVFIEYVHAGGDSIGIVALFDRKETDASMVEFISKRASAFMAQCQICEMIGQGQGGLTPSFWFVVGGQVSPWEMHEIDTKEMVATGRIEVLSSDDFLGAWRRVGITDKHRRIKDWHKQQGD